MKAIRIDPCVRTIEIVERETYSSIKDFIAEPLDSTRVWEFPADRLYVSDIGFMKAEQAFFSIGERVFAGRAVLVGPEGADVTATVEAIHTALEWVTPAQVALMDILTLG
jgi:hypothetical protein